MNGASKISTQLAEIRTDGCHSQSRDLRSVVEGKLEAPIHLVRDVLDLYFDPKYEEFRARTIWSLSNAFTSRFKQLEPIPQFKATAIRSVAEYSGDPPQRFPTSGFPVRYAFPLSVLPHNRQIDWETVV